jgi:hypothetical protein
MRHRNGDVALHKLILIKLDKLRMRSIIRLTEQNGAETISHLALSFAECCQDGGGSAARKPQENGKAVK